MKLFLPIFVLSLVLSSCATRPQGTFINTSRPAAPDYSDTSFWAALPSVEDLSDRTPNGLTNDQASAKADVFFLHPTTYTGKRGDNLWNGPIADPEVRMRTLEGPILFQASAFNGAGKIYAPYYRQAHLNVYYTKDTLSGRKALELAYSDVKQAFQYYLDHFNDGRPIIIASHSQGTTHSKQLLKDFFDGKPLQDQLVAAYIVGIPIRKTDFDHLQPCTDSLDTGCYVAWRTYRYGTSKATDPDVVVTNPLLWNSSTDLAPKQLNHGAVLRPFEEVRQQNVSAQINGPILWSSKPKFPGSFLMLRKNYHVGDINLFYLDIRDNAIQRVESFLNQTGH